MIDNIFMINKISQIKELSSELKFKILNELMLNAATCQQLADILQVSKQNVHYNIKGLLGEGLITTVADKSNNKEVYYRAKAQNYILDLSLGRNSTSGATSHREILNTILEENYGINLSYISAKLLKDCLALKARERLLVTTGKYNMPLVEKLLIEAARLQISTTLIYQHHEYIEAKNNDFSLSALIRDYDNFNALLAEHDVFLNLNGEARHVPMTDPDRQAIRNRAFDKSREIIKKNHIRVAIMPGLMKESLAEHDILSEINFWKALDIDYKYLYQATEAVSQNLLKHNKISIDDNGAELECQIGRVVCEYGSFGDNPKNSPIINLPGGQVLVLPVPGSLNGKVVATRGEVFGQVLEDLELTIKDNKVVTFTAKNPQLLEQAMAEGGPDAGVVALVCFNTNYNLGLGAIDTSFQKKAPGFLTLYWGENTSFGGTVSGLVEWTVRLDNPQLTLE